LKAGLLEEPSNIDKKLEQLIGRMVSERPEERPRLEEVLRHLQNYGADNPSDKTDSPRGQDKDKERVKEKPMFSMKSIGGFRIKHTTSTPAEFDSTSFESGQKYNVFLETPKVSKDYDCPSPSFSKSVKSAKSDSKTPSGSTIKIESKKSFDVVSSNSVNYTAKRKKEETPNLIEQIKSINKKRNLAFFIL
jgi:hypothetical protein